MHFMDTDSNVILIQNGVTIDGHILASAAAIKELQKEQGLIVTFNRKLEFEVSSYSYYRQNHQ